jgi:hypothetical protein
LILAIIPARQRQLIGTTAEWAANDILIGNGELAIETLSSSDKRVKIGNGTSVFSALPYSVTPGGISGGLFDYVSMASGSNIPSSILSVATKNYLTDGDGGGTIYKRVSAQPSHLGSFRSQDRFLPNGSTDATNGGWWEIVGSDLTPSQFGAKVDGTTDDAAALQACCNAVIAKGGGRVRLPAGTMRIKSTISLSVSTTINTLYSHATVSNLIKRLIFIQQDIVTFVGNCQRCVGTVGTGFFSNQLDILFVRVTGHSIT